MSKENTTFYKGNQLEKEFAEYMKTHLGYEKYRIQKRVKGKINSKGTDVDIIAQKTSDRGVRFKKVTIYYYIISSVLFIIGIMLLALQNTGIASLFLTLGIGGFASTVFFLVQSKRHDIEYGWVECKNLKTKVDLPKIDKILREYADCKAIGEIETRNCVLFFVSTSGFMENALKYAKSNGIICFEKNQNGEFIQSQYWT